MAEAPEPAVSDPAPATTASEPSETEPRPESQAVVEPAAEPAADEAEAKSEAEATGSRSDEPKAKGQRASNRAPKWETEAKQSIDDAIKSFRKPLSDLLKRDANEGDTRLLVTDFLCDALGYDKFDDLTTEFMVRGEFADYGVRIDKQLVAFIEVKRIAQKLNVRHLRQVETYAVKEGLEWCILTNGQMWQVYHVSIAAGQKVATTLVSEIDLLGSADSAELREDLFHIHRSALKRRTIDDVWRRQAAIAPDALTRMLLSDSVIDALRKEIRRESGYNPAPEDLVASLRRDVIRSEWL